MKNNNTLVSFRVDPSDKEYLSKDKSAPFSFRINKKDKTTFQNLYPYCLSRFVKRCISKAVKDKEFFSSIYFGD